MGRSFPNPSDPKMAHTNKKISQNLKTGWGRARIIHLRYQQLMFQKANKELKLVPCFQFCHLLCLASKKVQYEGHPANQAQQVTVDVRVVTSPTAPRTVQICKCGHQKTSQK